MIRASFVVPTQVSREVVGRMMADPAFVQKLCIENLITAIGSLWYEAEQRGDRFFKVMHFLASIVLICVDCLMHVRMPVDIYLVSSLFSGFCSGRFLLKCRAIFVLYS